MSGDAANRVHSVYSRLFGANPVSRFPERAGLLAVPSVDASFAEPADRGGIALVEELADARVEGGDLLHLLVGEEVEGVEILGNPIRLDGLGDHDHLAPA